MIEELITRSLILVFGYAYPAFQCFKTLEKSKVTVPELRFWCQYWILVALISIIEKVLDIFISWVPFYRAIKLIMYIYLWHPGTKGSTYMYDTVVQPYVSKHEPTIDRGIAELKERAWNLALSYWYKSANMSSKKLLECLQLLMTQVMNVALSRSQSQEGQSNDGATPTPPSTPSGVFKRNASDKRRPPVGPAGSVGTGSPTPKSDGIKVKLHNQAQFVHADEVSTPNSAKHEKSDNDQDFLAARVRLRSVNNKERLNN
ncbi:putative HVA22-like protein g [Salvia divinorum]|uniref:HVA22-like protein n=1 Tax=Salvia divinorum TaxID=28513 RepID=A0ABD1GDX9_SALDI